MNTRLAFFAVACLCLLSACSSAPSDPPISALIMTYNRSSAVGPTVHDLTDKAQITRLESFFPNYRSRPSSNIASGWKAGHEVYSNFPHGQTIHVTISENEDAAYWTVGDGDFDTQGDFNAFVASLPR